MEDNNIEASDPSRNSGGTAASLASSSSSKPVQTPNQSPRAEDDASAASSPCSSSKLLLSAEQQQQLQTTPKHDNLKYSSLKKTPTTAPVFADSKAKSGTGDETSLGGGVVVDDDEQRRNTADMRIMHPIPLPKPRDPSKCALFCCFYAEFDNKVGPQVVFQSPRNFMDQDISLPIEKIHEMLKDTFQKASSSSSSVPSDNNNSSNREESSTLDGGPNDSTKKSSNGEKPAAASQPDEAPSQGEESSRPTSTEESSATAAATSSSSSSSLSIFDSLSEYIITGAELTGNVIHLSTHHMHVLTRPTIIADELRYERNSLLFCVGFVLRREKDPRPFRPILSKLALTLRDMELETQFLSNHKTRPQLQQHLERMLISLNTSPTTPAARRQHHHQHHHLGPASGAGGSSSSSTAVSGGGVECNLILSPAHVLNLKLFHPPKVPAYPVPDRAVPVLLKRDWQVQTYDWDLSINWVSLHIDGVTNARQISKKADVDMQMVRACLRVLRHHGVIALVDMFFFSNRYECTDRAAALMLASAATTAGGGDHAEVPAAQQLLSDAVDFCVRSRQHHVGSNNSSAHHLHHSGFGNTNNSSHETSPLFLAQHSPGSSYLLEQAHQHQQQQQALNDSTTSNIAAMIRRDDKYYQLLKTAVAELYCICQRNQSFGSMWINLCEGGAGGASGPLRHQQQQQQQRRKAKMWRKIFRDIDHRRFVSFGLVHGLIKRVHNYPYFLDAPDAFHDDNRRQDDVPRHDRIRGSGAWRNHDAARGDLRTLPSRIASQMDGMHCDDDLVCEFNRSIEELLEIVGRTKVSSVYATSDFRQHEGIDS